MSEQNWKTLVGVVVLLVVGYFLLSKAGVLKFGEKPSDELEKTWEERQRFEEILPSSSPSRAEKSTININFSQTGNLVKTDDGAWALLYEEPGNPALQIKLMFVDGSVCDFEKGGRCDQSLFTIGDRVKVEGEKKDNTVTVAGMTKLVGE